MSAKKFRGKPNASLKFSACLMAKKSFPGKLSRKSWLDRQAGGERQLNVE